MSTTIRGDTARDGRTDEKVNADTERGELHEPRSGSRERTRLREVYAARDTAMPLAAWKDNIYHPRHPLGHLFHEHNHGTLVAALNDLDLDLAGLRALDVGCGWGYWLRYLVDLGADPALLSGIDLSQERIAAARASNPAIEWVHHDASVLPFPDDHFDLVIQVVVFSSIRDANERAVLAAEMLRVVRPGGHILFVDHKRNHGDQLVGFSPEAVAETFGGSRIVYQQGVHPSYFRTLAETQPWLAPALYRLTKRRCDSWFLALEVAK